MSVNLKECPFCGARRQLGCSHYECGLHVIVIADGIQTINECQNCKHGESIFKVNLDMGNL